jgi:hypothetical protein
MYLLLPITAYSLIFHNSIPALSHPVKDKLQLGRIFTAAIVFCFVAYTLIAVVISMYFGDNTLVSANLNWSAYTGNSSNGRSNSVDATSASLLAKAASLFVVLLPALDVASAFPLNAITLGNNLMSAYYGSRIHEAEENRRALSVFRLVAAVPPVLAASLVDDLGVITKFTGVSGFALTFIFPALLVLRSEIICLQHGLPSRTYYCSWLTNKTSCYLSILFGAFLVIFMFASLLFYGLG